MAECLIDRMKNYLRVTFRLSQAVKKHSCTKQLWSSPSTPSLSTQLQFLCVEREMWITLLLLVTYPLFDWSKRKSVPGLATSFSTIIKVITGTEVDVSPNSDVYCAALKFNYLVNRKHKKKGLEWICQHEAEILRQNRLYVTRTPESREIKKDDSNNNDEIVSTSSSKRKCFKDLKSKRMKKGRVDNILVHLENDEGLEGL